MAGDERYTLVLFERFVATTLNLRVMGEEVFTAQFRHDEAEAFVVVEPLHNTSFNLQCKSLMCREKYPCTHYGLIGTTKISLLQKDTYLGVPVKKPIFL